MGSRLSVTYEQPHLHYTWAAACPLHMSGRISTTHEQSLSITHEQPVSITYVPFPFSHPAQFAHPAPVHTRPAPCAHPTPLACPTPFALPARRPNSVPKSVCSVGKIPVSNSRPQSSHSSVSNRQTDPIADRTARSIIFHW